jgi:hypothetical protein
VVRQYAERSDELLRGTSTRPLGEVLRQMPHLIKKPDTESRD